MTGTTGRRIALMAAASGLLAAGLARTGQAAQERIDDAREAASSALRGDAPNLVIMDEASDWPDAEAVMDSLADRVVAVGDPRHIEMLGRLREIRNRIEDLDDPILRVEPDRVLDRPSRGSPARKPPKPRSSYAPHQGARERERRLRRVARSKES